MTDLAELRRLAEAFLMWPLPQTVCSDLCATDPKYQFPRSGTNLLNADEALQMVTHLFTAQLERLEAAEAAVQVLLRLPAAYDATKETPDAP